MSFTTDPTELLHLFIFKAFKPAAQPANGVTKRRIGVLADNYLPKMCCYAKFFAYSSVARKP